MSTALSSPLRLVRLLACLAALAPLITTAQTDYTTNTTITTTMDLGSGDANVKEGATLTVTGAGHLQTTGTLSVGFYDGGLITEALVISNGGKLQSGTTIIGKSTGNGTAVVTGTNSVLSATSLFIGQYGVDGELTLSNGGTVNVNSGAGTLQLGYNFYSVTPNGILNIGAAAANAATGAGILNAASVNTEQGNGTLQFNHTGTTYFTKDGTSGGTAIITNDGSGTLSLIHTAGTTYFTGNFDHDGASTINGGTAYFNNTNSSSAVTVNSGGGIGGTGSLGNGLTLNNGSNLNFALGTGFSSLDITGGNLVFNGTITINFTDAGGFDAGATYNLIDASTASFISSLDTGIFTISGISGYTHTLNWSSNVLQLTSVSAVPEPSTYAIILGVCALGLAAWRRRAHR